MSEYNKRVEPNIYETIAPEMRFINIATIILEKIGESPPESGGSVKFARWPNSLTGDHYKLQAAAQIGMWGESRILFMLDHFSPELPSNVPKNRYYAHTDGESMGSIKITDGKNKEKVLNDTERREAIRFILNALTDAAPEDAAKILKNTFENRFEGLAGDYVLSELALQKPTPQIDEALINTAYTNHENHIDEVKKDELKKAKKRKRSVLDSHTKLPQPAYYESVEEAAAESRRGPTNKNAYAPVDVLAATKRAVQEMKGKWQHTISSNPDYPTA
ncbi:MAG: hypothetical protein H6797_03670 [Candidatus Nomurabacteria bacterium]|nr:MAG: hypothetical protein H6797_03670 [Candidatus Nomurabacteria bacterium]